MDPAVVIDPVGTAVVIPTVVEDKSRLPKWKKIGSFEKTQWFRLSDDPRSAIYRDTHHTHPPAATGQNPTSG